MFGYGEWQIQSLDHNTIAIEVNDLAASKKSPIRILHVDDDPSLREITKLMLQDFDGSFEIDNVCCVTEAFEKIGNHRYDAIVSDLEMPQKNGLEFLKELREQKNDIAFIIFTGRGREEVAVNALNLGADRYIDKNGSPETVYCELANAIIKIVERKKTKNLLVESESKYRTLVEESLQGILIARGLPPRIVFANSAMSKMLGYTVEEFNSFSPQEVMNLIHCEDREVFFNRFKDRMLGIQKESSLDFRAVRKDGLIVWMQASSNRIQYHGQPALQAMFLDIDERKKSEEIVRKSETKYRELANSLPGIVFEAKLTGELEFVNDRALELSGYSDEDFKKGLNVLQFLVPEDRQKVMQRIQLLLVGGGHIPAEYVFLRKDGTTFPALITTTLRISENMATGLRGFVIDITEHKKVEEELKKNQVKMEIRNEKLKVVNS